MSRSSFRAGTRQHNGTATNSERYAPAGRGGSGRAARSTVPASTGSTGSGDKDRSNGKAQHERLLFWLSVLLGEEVEVETRSKEIFRGVLHACSVESLEPGVVLKFARLKDPQNTDETFKPVKSEPIPTLIIQGSDLVQILVADTSLEDVVSRQRSETQERASRTGFQTDKQISGRRGPQSGRELKRFDDYAVEIQTDHSLVGELSGKSDGWDQFAINKTKFGVLSSYDENEYTTVIDKSTPDFREKEREASKIAAEIESKTSKNVHVRSERGQTAEGAYDEEDLFSTVIASDPPQVHAPPEDDATTRDLRNTDFAVLKAVSAGHVAGPVHGANGESINPVGGSTADDAPGAPGPFNPDSADDRADRKSAAGASSGAGSQQPPSPRRPSQPGQRGKGGRSQPYLSQSRGSGSHASQARSSRGQAAQAKHVPAEDEQGPDTLQAPAQATAAAASADWADEGAKTEDVQNASGSAKAGADAPAARAADGSIKIAQEAKEKNDDSGGGGGDDDDKSSKPGAAKAPKKKLKFNPNAAEFRPSSSIGAPGGAMPAAPPASVYYPVPGGEMRPGMSGPGPMFPNAPPLMPANIMGWPNPGRGGMIPPSYVPRFPMVPAPQLARHVTPGGMSMMTPNYVPMTGHSQQFVPYGMVYTPQGGGLQGYAPAPQKSGNAGASGSGGDMARRGGGRNSNRGSSSAPPQGATQAPGSSETQVTLAAGEKSGSEGAKVDAAASDEGPNPKPEETPAPGARSGAEVVGTLGENSPAEQVAGPASVVGGDGGNTTHANSEPAAQKHVGESAPDGDQKTNAPAEDPAKRPESTVADREDGR